MRVGVSLNSTYQVDDVRDGARRMIERAGAARRAELDSLFVGDHHNVPVPYYQNTPMLGRLLAEWSDAPAGALFLLPLWHPVVAAEQIGTLAAIAQGRFIVQCAIGGGDDQFRALGKQLKHRPSHFEAALEIIRALLAGDEVTTSEPLAVWKARIALIPPEPVEVWIGAAAPPAIERAARLGDAWLAGPELTLTTAKEQLDQYRVACERFGRAPTCVPIRRDVFVGADDAEVEAHARPVVEAGYRGFDPTAPVVGTAEVVAEAFRQYAALGYTDVIVRQLVPDQARAVASIERLAEVRQLVADA